MPWARSPRCGTGAKSITVVVPRPAFVSQKTSLDHLGIPSARFLAMVRAPGFPLHVASVGKLRVVETEAMIAYLRGLGAAPENLDRERRPVDNDTNLAAEPSPESEDSAARKLGAALGFRFEDQEQGDPGLRRTGRGGKGAGMAQR